MTTPIQTISNAAQLLSVDPLYPLQNTSSSNAVGSVAASSEIALPTPSSITVLAASNPLDLLTYNVTDPLQSFVTSFFVSGLTAGQQQQLALALGLSANATSTDLTNAINMLLTPANPADELVNVLVGGVSTSQTSTNPVLPPSFPDANGEIAGVALSPLEQATETMFGTLLNAGAVSNLMTNTTVPTSTTGTETTIATTAATAPFVAPPASTTSVVVPSMPASGDLSSSSYALPFDSADSVLQSLLIEETSHLLLVTDQGMAAYAAPGTIAQLQAGVDQPHQANLKDHWPETFYTTNPVTRVAPSHEPLK